MEFDNPDLELPKKLIARINAAKAAPRNWIESGLLLETNMILEAFVVDEVQEWTPNGGQQAGWILYALDGKVYSIGGLIWQGQLELVSFDEIEQFGKPEIGDLAIVLRDASSHKRKGIGLLRD